MPLCVARQCNVWGVSRSAARPLQSTISTQWRRAYSIQPIEGGEQGAVLRKPKSAIIIPRSVAVSPDDLIKHIKPLEIHEYRNYRFALFLLTPSFAQWLLEGNTFLEKAVHQAFSPVLQSTAFAKVHAFAAVVDKLPSPQAIHEPPQWGLPRDRSSPPNVDSELGNEGLAYKFLRPHNVVRSAHRSNMDEKGSISFILSEASDGRVETSRLIRLPLANTVFQTGAHSTMALSTWEKPKNRQELAIVSKSELIHQEFRLDSSKAASQDTVFSIPLVPLTMPRVVDAAMGNILRRVIGSDGKVITASEELEKAVPQYFKSRDEPSQSISVWALVIPNNMRELVNNDFHRLVAEIQLDEGKSNSGVTTDVWAQLWKNGGRTWSPLVVNALNAGCRLYRVLSGGGGWGKKAGLLSLDPAFNNEELEGPTVAATPINLQGLDEISSALRQVVKPGELIQFFTSSSVAKVYEQSSEDIPEDLKKLESLYTPWTGEYGTIPSTVDALQSNSWQHAVSNEGRSGESFVFLDNFGALSEGGMTFRVQERIITPDSIATVNGCKIDVPFSWLGTREESHDPNAIATTNGKRAVPDERQQRTPRIRGFGRDTRPPRSLSSERLLSDFRIHALPSALTIRKMRTLEAQKSPTQSDNSRPVLDYDPVSLFLRSTLENKSKVGLSSIRKVFRDDEIARIDSCVEQLSAGVTILREMLHATVTTMERRLVMKSKQKALKASKGYGTSRWRTLKRHTKAVVERSTRDPALEPPAECPVESASVSKHPKSAHMFQRPVLIRHVDYRLTIRYKRQLGRVRLGVRGRGRKLESTLYPPREELSKRMKPMNDLKRKVKKDFMKNVGSWFL